MKKTAFFSAVVLGLLLSGCTVNNDTSSSVVSSGVNSSSQEDSSLVDNSSDNLISTSEIATSSDLGSTDSTVISSTTPEADTTAPLIHGAENVTITLGVAFNPWQDVTATDNVDGDITHLIDLILPDGLTLKNGRITFPDVGDYTLVYEVSDAAGNETRVNRIVSVEAEPVIDNVSPIIYGYQNHDIYVDQEIDVMDGVTANDDVDGDISERIEVTYPAEAIINDRLVKFSVAGTYEVTLSVSDTAKNTTSVSITITVSDYDLISPVISASNITVAANKWVSLSQNVSAIDETDGDLTNKIKIDIPEDLMSYDNYVQFATPGTYKVTYSVSDSSGNEAEKTIDVIVGDSATVVDNNLIENSEMLFGRHILVTNGGSGMFERTTTTMMVHVNDVVEDRESIYLERNLLSFTNNLTTTSFNVSGNTDIDDIDIVAGYYNDNDDFITISTQKYTGGIPTNFTPPVTTTKGAVRIIFNSIGQFELTDLHLQTNNGSGSNPNIIRDRTAGAGYGLPQGWYTESSGDGLTGVIVHDDEKGSALKFTSTATAAPRLNYENFTLNQTKTYILKYDMKASVATDITLAMGTSTQSATVSNTLSNLISGAANLTDEWKTFSLEFTPTATNSLYKLRFTLGKNIDYYLTNVSITEKEIPLSDEFSNAFVVAVNEIGEVTPTSGGALDAALALYDGLSDIDQAKDEVIAAYADLMEKFLELAGFDYFEFADSAFYVNDLIHLDDYVLNYSGSGSVVIKYNDSELDDYEFTFTTSGTFVFTYLLVEDDVIAIYKRTIIVGNPTPKTYDSILVNGDFSKYKYELYADGNEAASITRNVANLVIEIEDADQHVYLERLGVSFRNNLTSSNLAFVATYSGLSTQDIEIGMGYYLETGKYYEVYRCGIGSDGKTTTSFTPKLSMDDGVMRIYFKKAGTATVSGITYQAPSGIMNIVRDSSGGAFQAPAYFSHGSSAIALTSTVSNNVWTAQNTSGSSSVSIFYENFALQVGNEYIITFTASSNQAAEFSLEFANYYQSTTTNAFTSSSKTNYAQETYNLTTSEVEYTLLISTIDPLGSNASNLDYKLNFTFAKGTTYYLKNFVITKKV